MCLNFLLDSPFLGSKPDRHTLRCCWSTLWFDVFFLLGKLENHRTQWVISSHSFGCMVSTYKWKVHINIVPGGTSELLEVTTIIFFQRTIRDIFPLIPHQYSIGIDSYSQCISQQTSISVHDPKSGHISTQLHSLNPVVDGSSKKIPMELPRSFDAFLATAGRLGSGVSAVTVIAFLCRIYILQPSCTGQLATKDFRGDFRGMVSSLGSLKRWSHTYENPIPLDELGFFIHLLNLGWAIESSKSTGKMMLLFVFYFQTCLTFRPYV